MLVGVKSGAIVDGMRWRSEHPSEKRCDPEWMVPKIVANGFCSRIVASFGDAAEIGRTRGWYGPCVDQGRYPNGNQSGLRARTGRRRHQFARQHAVASVVIRNQIHTGLMQMLLEAFKISKDKGLVFFNRGRPALRHIDSAGNRGRSSDRRNCGRLARCCAGTRKRIPWKSLLLDCVTMRTSPAGPFAVLGSVGIAQHVETRARRRRLKRTPLVPPGCILFSAAPVNSTPFNENRFCCGRLPSTTKLFPLVEFDTPVPPIFCEVKLTTPGSSVINRSKLRAFSGRSRIWSWLITPDASDVETLTSGASSFTVICWLDSPTCSVRSTTALWFTAS